MKILQTPTFQRKYKKLHKGERDLVNSVLDEILEDFEVGLLKKGDLGSLRVHKKRKGKQEFLVAYWSTKGAINGNLFGFVDVQRCKRSRANFNNYDSESN